MNVLFVTPDLSPVSGDTPLGRVVAQLASALTSMGHKVVACAPMIDDAVVDQWSLARRLRPVPVEVGERVVEVHVFDGRLPSGVEVELFAHDELFLGRPGLTDDEDEPLRQVVLARAALALAAADTTDWHLVHGVSVPGAVAIHMAGPSGLGVARTVLTVADLVRQGRCDRSWIDRLALDPEGFTPEGFEFYGDVNLLKAGLVAADRLLFPSNSMLFDARREDRGKGLDGVIRSRGNAALGLLPGLDYSRWNPSTDIHLPSRYDAELLTGKQSCKADLQNRLGLPVRTEVPLVAMVPLLSDLATPLTKGLDRMLRAEVQVIAPRGLARPLEARMDEAVSRWPDQVARLELDERAEHQLLGAADLILVDAPQDGEANWLLRALRYGTLPIVRPEGLARDLVVDLTGTLDSGNGFLLQSSEPAELLSGLRRATAATRRTFDGSRPFSEAVSRAMRRQLGWEDVARKLEQVYGEVLSPSAPAEPCADGD